MFTPDQYELLDFGDGRKLERFGEYILDRESPAADVASRSEPELWRQADAKFERRGNKGRWRVRGEMPLLWPVGHGAATLELKRTDFGHVGLFAEQAANWDWLAERSRDLKVLNLFAYTGGSTLAAAMGGGAEIVHVDAARNTVAWASRNAELSGLADAPIRWIVEDAAKFVHREVKRGNRYDAVVLDPPSYGHGPKGEDWILERDLPQLLADCGELIDSRHGFVLLTCHTAEVDAETLAEMLQDTLPQNIEGTIATDGMTLTTADGRRLESGVTVRWTVSR